MDDSQEVREFLTSRRAGITSAQAGMSTGPRRRVLGLRLFAAWAATQETISRARHPAG
ncbi:hypothetical protein HEB29_005509 [Streptomyces fulvorobeus]|uniref:Uncharacterized protein n=1 Tax=Streptomyces fulvorobeus TaxID=284028 RepID=A0A7Y9HH91_9ACTN|nr:hypothetical protein [Streptomyces fulvorobeus]